MKTNHTRQDVKPATETVLHPKAAPKVDPKEEQTHKEDPITPPSAPLKN